jgi:DNA-binding IclR family transcriptional regulator
MAKTSIQERSGTPVYAVESVDSALKILRLLCDEKRLRVSDVAARLSVAQSTVHRLLSMLVHHGFAMQNEKRGEYRAGPMFLEMGFAALRDLEIRQYARPILEEVREEVDETVHLGVPYGLQVFYVEGVESRQALRVGLRVGSFHPAHRVGLGMALLATLNPEELRSLYPTDDLLTVYDKVESVDQLAVELDEVRRRGFARSRSGSNEGVSSVAIAILDRRGIARAAIGVSAPKTRITPEREAEWAVALRAAAEKLRGRLWNQPDVVGVKP